MEKKDLTFTFDPNDLGNMCELMDKYGDSDTMFMGVNTEFEETEISIFPDKHWVCRNNRLSVKRPAISSSIAFDDPHEPFYADCDIWQSIQINCCQRLQGLLSSNSEYNAISVPAKISPCSFRP